MAMPCSSSSSTSLRPAFASNADVMPAGVAVGVVAAGVLYHRAAAKQFQLPSNTQVPKDPRMTDPAKMKAYQDAQNQLTQCVG